MKPSSSSTTSLWRDRPGPIADDVLDPSARLDDLVVGAGITGLTTALLLARAGRRVAVLEAGDVGSLASGNTTAKVSLLQGTKLSRMLSHQSLEVVRAVDPPSLSRTARGARPISWCWRRAPRSSTEASPSPRSSPCAPTPWRSTCHPRWCREACTCRQAAPAGRSATYR
ncbi:FAD-dependent oxidoreductase [Aeromicrobium endophyticum]|uniref:FAD-dependent oxidoreductase n=1 Tax=Aeromicrobium endophyticum TaxID=2292704 RepID=UPI0018F44E5A